MKLRDVVLIFASLAIAARAAEPFYLGTWKIESAVVAPWVKGKAHDVDTAEMKLLIAKIMVIKPSEITGPRIFV